MFIVPSKIKLNSDNLKFSLNILKFREWMRCPLRPLRPLQSQSNFIREKEIICDLKSCRWIFVSYPG